MRIGQSIDNFQNDSESVPVVQMSTRNSICFYELTQVSVTKFGLDKDFKCRPLLYPSIVDLGDIWMIWTGDGVDTSDIEHWAWIWNNLLTSGFLHISELCC